MVQLPVAITKAVLAYLLSFIPHSQMTKEFNVILSNIISQSLCRQKDNNHSLKKNPTIIKKKNKHTQQQPKTKPKPTLKPHYIALYGKALKIKNLHFS